MTTGVMIVPPFNEISIPLIKYGFTATTFIVIILGVIYGGIG